MTFMLSLRTHQGQGLASMQAATISIIALSVRVDSVSCYSSQGHR